MARSDRYADLAATAAALFLLTAAPPSLAAQASDPHFPGSGNVQLLSHVDLEGPEFSRSDIELEQELERPYAYVGRILNPTFGFDVIDLSDPANARVLYEWRIEDAELHQGLGGMDPKYFKLDGRYYLVQSMQFFQGGPDADLGAVVFDVTGLPDPAAIREVGRIRFPEAPGGFHNIFAYKHSSGRVLLITTVTAAHGNIYDMERFLAGDEDQGLIGRVPWPSPSRAALEAGMVVGPMGYHDFFAAYDPATGRDMLYGSGLDGYYIFDISTPEEPELVTSVVGVQGLDIAHQMSVEPTHRYAVGQTEILYSPVRIYDLKPGLEGEVETISEALSVWTPDWRHFTHNHEIRWPYVFVASFEDGLQIFNMRNPQNPTTVGHFDTFPYPSPRLSGTGLDPRTWKGGNTGFNGAWGVDIRNADGLIVTSDFTTGFWSFRLDGLDRWEGADWGVPDISSAQDWDNGPVPRQTSAIEARRGATGG